MHAGSAVPIERLWDKGRCLAILISSVANDVFEYLQIVGSAQHRCVAKVDFALARGGHFVVMTFDGDATLSENQRNLRAKIAQGINWRNRNVPFFATNVIAEVGAAKFVCVA